MADYCKEYVEKHNASVLPDFSIAEIFTKLDDNCMMSYKCDGYGFVAVGNNEGKPCVLYRNVNDAECFDIVEMCNLDNYYKDNIVGL